MNYIMLPLGPVQTNTYVIWNDKKEGIIIDPSASPSYIMDACEEREIQVKAILLTHAHFDHIGALQGVYDHYKVPVYIHKKETSWLRDSRKNGSLLFGLPEVKADVPVTILKEEGMLQIGSFEIQVLFTPGHSPGSVSYYFAKDAVVFSGDALFYGSIGRTDLPMGNGEQLQNSIKTKLYTLPDRTIVAPGHGTETEVAQEKRNNPFVRV